MFYDNISIGGVYGSFPKQIWNGGRPNLDNRIIPLENVEEIFKIYREEFNTQIQLTYTNSLLTEYHLNDEYCNEITKIANKYNAEVLCNNSLLEEYLRKNYPNLKYSLSVTKNIEDIPTFNKLIKENKYENYVLHCFLNKNFEQIQKIQNKEKVEIILNQTCQPFCPYTFSHYDEYNFYNLYGHERYPDSLKCKNNRKCNFLTYKQYLIGNTEMNIFKEELYDKYIKELGFSKFKIVGRDFLIYTIMEFYLYYLVKPEYYDEIRHALTDSYLYDLGV